MGSSIDISQSTLNCLTFSDTVILWTNSTTLNDFEEILRVAHKYNQFNVTLDFPSRGCIVYGDIRFKPFDQENLRGGKYMLNMIYGRALIDAYQRAEAMNWAGCELHESAIIYAKTQGNIDSLLEELTKPYQIPFKSKDGETRVESYTLKLFDSRILITEYYEAGMKSAFTQDNKGDIEGRTKILFDNTIEFLRSHQIPFPFYYTEEKSPTNQIFGKFEADYTHTIISVTSEDASRKYKKDIELFDPGKSDRSFFDAQEVSKDVFDKYFALAS